MGKLGPTEWFEKLTDAAVLAGFEVVVAQYGVIKVAAPGTDGNYSREVRDGESFDECARIMFKALRRSNVI